MGTCSSGPGGLQSLFIPEAKGNLKGLACPERPSPLSPPGRRLFQSQGWGFPRSSIQSLLSERYAENLFKLDILKGGTVFRNPNTCQSLNVRWEPLWDSEWARPPCRSLPLQH